MKKEHLEIQKYFPGSTLEEGTEKFALHIPAGTYAISSLRLPTDLLLYAEEPFKLVAADVYFPAESI